jgi:hypothetical protein
LRLRTTPSLAALASREPRSASGSRRRGGANPHDIWLKKAAEPLYLRASDELETPAKRPGFSAWLPEPDRTTPYGPYLTGHIGNRGRRHASYRPCETGQERSARAIRISLPKLIVDIATGQVEDKPDPRRRFGETPGCGPLGGRGRLEGWQGANGQTRAGTARRDCQKAAAKQWSLK